MNAEKLVQRAIVVSVVLSGMTLLLYAWLSSYMRIFADDYCSADLSTLTDPFSAAIGRYNTWNGRYVDSFLQQVFSPFKPEVHTIIPVVAIILWFCATYYFLSRIQRFLQLKQTRSLTFGIAIVMTFTFYRIMPAYQHAYWLSAIIPYTLPLILLIFWGGSIFHYFSKPRSKLSLIIFILWSGFIMLIIGGLTEALIIFCGTLALLMLFVTPKISVSIRRQFMIFVIVTGLFTALALAIAVLSPGSWARRASGAELSGVDLTPLEALPSGIVFTLAYLFGELVGITFGQTFGIAFLGSLFLLGFISGLYYLERNPEVTLPAPHNLILYSILVLLIGLLLTFSIIYPSVYAVRGDLPLRPLSFPRFVQFSMVLVWLYLALVAAQRNQFLNVLQNQRLWSVVLIFATFLIIWTPSVSIYKLAAYIPDFSTFAEQWDIRHEVLLNQELDAVVVYPTLDYNIEDEFVLLRAISDTDFWINDCMEGYYNLSELIIEGSDEPLFE